MTDNVEKNNLSDQELFDYRFSICQGCEFFAKRTQVCKKCGCYMKIRTALKKVQCPIGKW